MATVIVYRSRSASFAANRVAAASSGDIRAVQQDAYRHQEGDTAVVRWDCYVGLSHPDSVLDVNPAARVAVVRDKTASRILLAELAPQTWFSLADVQVPCVIRPRRHKAGAHFHIVRETSDILRATRRCGSGWYASRLITKQREFRVFMVQGRVAAVSERFPRTEDDGNTSAIAWNLALGGRLINIARPDWPVGVLKASITAMERLDLGFGAVDACIDTAGQTFIFEVNCSPALRNKFTIKQLAKALAFTGDVSPVKTGAKKAKSFVHPAVLPREEAAIPAQSARPFVEAAPAEGLAEAIAPVQLPLQGDNMPAVATSTITDPQSSDHILVVAGEAKSAFIARAEMLFDSCFDRERNRRRLEIEAQIAELRQRLDSGSF